MKFTVAWTPKATAELAELWLSASDKQAMTESARLLDRRLADKPLDERHEIVRGRGTAVRVPLGVDFQIDVAKQIVVVTGAWFAAEV